MPEKAGMKNVYTCQKCMRHTITITLVDGTTPFMMFCTSEGCDGDMHSCFYQVPNHLKHFSPSHEWYRPSNPKKYAKRFKGKYARSATIEHIEMGGLILREIKGEK